MAKKTIWDLALNIAGEDKGATAALKQVKKQIEDVQSAAKQLGNDWKTFTQNAAKLTMGVVGGVAAAGAATVSLANSFAQTGDKVAKTSAAIGIGIEAYQGLQYAMGQCGLSADEFDGALQKFNLTVRQGAAGNAAAQKQLEAIGLSASKLADMKPEQAMERLSDYMKSLPNDAERTRAAVTLFGKAAGPKMMAAMKQGSAGLKELMDEAKAMGAVLTEEQAHQSEAYIGAMDRLKTSVTGMKNQFIGGAIGPLTQAFDHLKNAVVEQMPAIQELGKNFGQFLGDVVKRLPEIIAGIKDFGTWVKDTVTGVKDFVGGWKNLAKIMGAVAIAPTLISGLKVVWSFGKLINTVIVAWPAIMAKIPLMLGPISAAALPIIGIIAGIAAVIFTVVRNFDNLKKYALDCIDRIKSAFGGSSGEMGADFKKVGEVIKTVLGVLLKILEGGVLFAIKTVMNAITSAVQIVIGVFRVLWNVAKLVFWPIVTIIKVIAGLFTGGLSGAIEAVKGQFGKLGEIFGGIFGGLRAIIDGITGFFKGQFQNAIEWVNRIFGGFFGFVAGIFEKVKAAITAVADFFKNVFSGAINFVKGVAGGLGGFFSGLFGGIKSAAGKVADFFKGGFKSAVEGIKGIASNVGEKFGDAVEKVKGKAAAFADNWKNAVKSTNPAIISAIGFFKNCFKGGIDTVKEIAPELTTAFGTAFGNLKKKLPSVISAFRGGFGNGINAVKDLLPELIGPFGGVFGKIRDKLDGVTSFFKSAFNGLVDKANGIIPGLGDVFTNVFNTIKNGFDAVVQVAKTGFSVIGNVAKVIIWPIETVIKIVRALFTDGIGGAVSVVGEQFEKLKGLFGNIADGIRTIISTVTDFFKNAFKSGVEAVYGLLTGLSDKFGGVFTIIKNLTDSVTSFFKNAFANGVSSVTGIIDGLVGKFTAVFDSIKGKVTEFTSFFTSKFDSVKNVVGGIGSAISGLFGKGGDKASGMPAHAAGGIFTHKHIAEIAEKGAEAVVPLNKTSQGFDIWKQAGEIGGYLERLNTRTATAGVTPRETPPIMQAAAQKVSQGGEFAINVSFTQNNNFSGGAPDDETISRISAAGNDAADDIKDRVKTALEEIMRDKRRLAYG
jgi:phage-related protein